MHYSTMLIQGVQWW